MVTVDMRNLVSSSSVSESSEVGTCLSVIEQIGHRLEID